ncbi:MAG: dihydroorotate dehydrogenase, partial [Candidatus Doudnabacteria bacterium CG10_big_fil_rev_8_21_14_0_10_41_10]
MPNLQIKFLEKSFSNPLVLPSGIAQNIPSDHNRFIRLGVGAITTKSLTIEPRVGNPIPRVINYPHGYLNSVGLLNPGIEKGKRLIADFLKTSNIPVFVSVFADTSEKFKTIVSEIAELNPPFIELNLSCPNVSHEFGKILGTEVKSASEAVKASKAVAGNIPLVTKLTPNVANISEVAKACEASGADAISAINTVGPGMVINLKTKKPVLGAKKGGVSGPGIKPVAVRCIYDIFESVKIPIIGTGGVTTAEDALEVMMAGATLVGVGSAWYIKGDSVFEDIKKGLLKYMEKEKIESLS